MPDVALPSLYEMYCAAFTKKTKPLSPVQPDALKYPPSCIHTPHGKILLFITLSKNAGATCSGVEAAYRALKKKGKVKNTHKFITFGGDGGTYDIGFQSLSGAMERNHDMVYVCYDNGAYMNTGIQRSLATPMYADTTTTPVGSESDGKHKTEKDLTQVIAAHNIPYVAQTTFVQNFKDLHTKQKKQSIPREPPS